MKQALTGVAQLVGRCLVRSLVVAHAWVAVLVPGWGVYEKQPTDVSFSHGCFSPSLSPSLYFSLKISEYNL